MVNVDDEGKEGEGVMGGWGGKGGVKRGGNGDGRGKGGVKMGKNGEGRGEKGKGNEWAGGKG